MPDRNPVTLAPVVYTLPRMDAVEVRVDVEFRASDGAPAMMDIYRPPNADIADISTPLPVVVIVPGYLDAGMQRVLGCRHKEMRCTIDWARLIAASGMMAVAYSNRAPAADLAALLAHLRDHAFSLGIDATRIGLWSCSGNVPVALSALVTGAPIPIACAALLCGYLLDLDGATAVADAAKTYGFANPCEGRSMDDFDPRTPIFVARAGRDEFAGLNASLDRFAAAALTRNLRLSLVNHAEGPHAFDLMDSGDVSREVIRLTLAFLQFHLGGRPGGRA